MLLAAFFAGFLQDVLSPIPLGYSSFCFCIVGLIAGRFRNVVMIESALPPLVFGGAAGAATTVAFYLLLAKEQLIACPLWYLLLKIIGTGVLGALCTPLIFLVAGKFDRMMGNVTMKEETVVLDIE
jgi:rod shape-determining protein MreD